MRIVWIIFLSRFFFTFLSNFLIVFRLFCLRTDQYWLFYFSLCCFLVLQNKVDKYKSICKNCKGKGQVTCE